MPDLKLIHKQFEAITERFPDHCAIEVAEDQITYQALNGQANALSHVLTSIGVGKDTIVAAVLEPGVALVKTMLASFKSGAIYMPVDIHFAQARLEQIFEDTFHGILVTTPEFESKVLSLLDTLNIQLSYLIILDEVGLTVKKGGAEVVNDLVPFSENPEVNVALDDSNYIFYTSGSTGKGKPILGQHKSLSHFIQWEIEEFGIDSTVRVSQLIQHTFDASFRDILVPLCAGGTICFPTKEVKANTIQLVDWLRDNRINLMHTVPSIFRMITRDMETGALDNLKKILLAGEPLYVRDVQEWQKKASKEIELINLYGLTETTLLKTFHRINQLPDEPAEMVHIGHAMPGTEIIIADNGKRCKAGETGEIYIKTEYLSKGYYNNQALNDQVFVASPIAEDKENIVFRTGDLGAYLPDGNIAIKGRRDDQVKVNGIRVEPGEIKQALLQEESITAAIIKPWKSEESQIELAAYFTAKEQVNIEALRESLSVRINRSIVPTYLIQLDQFPLNANGKVDKQALPHPSEFVKTSINEPGDAVEKTATESGIENIWQQVLKTDQSLCTDVSFFELGGNSLKAIQMISRLFKQFKVLLNVADIYAHPSISAIASLIESKHAEESSVAQIAKVKEQDSYELSHAQKRIWLLNQAGNSANISNMPEAFIIKGQLDRQALETAFRGLIERHESLRTVFQEVDGAPRQIVKLPTEVDFRLDSVDLSHEPQPLDEAKRKAQIAAEQPFTLESGPLIRCHIYSISEGQYLALLNTHHTIADAWSIEVLFKELFERYSAQLIGKPYKAKPLKIQYKDYTAWHNDQLKGEKRQKLRDFWISELKDLGAATSFPILQQEVSGDKASNEGATGFVIEESLAGQLKKIAKHNDASLFMVMHSLLALLVNKYSGDADLLIGVPVTGRDRIELEDQIGYYVNMLPVRIGIEAGDTFKALLKRTKKQFLKAYEHQAYPIDLIIGDLQTDEASDTQLFQIMSQLQNKVQQGDAEHGLEIEGADIGYMGNMGHQISFKFEEVENEIKVIVAFNNDQLSEDGIEQIIDNYLHLAQAVTAQPEVAVDALTLTSSQDEQDEQDEFMKSMLEM
ncbi:MAG: amino acid adenylation domain-containing protein [Bacteroidota bacterium]